MGESINWSDDPLQVYLSAVSEVPPLEKSEETACIDHVRAGDDMAENVWLKLIPTLLSRERNITDTETFTSSI